LPLDLGKRVPHDLKKDERMLIFFSNDFHSQYPWTHDGIDYVLLTSNNSDTINGIICEDRRFETPEGVRVGHTLKEVRRIAGVEYETMAGFGYWVPLPSGWNAVFFQGHSATDGALPPEATVKLIAKSEHLNRFCIAQRA
jgi:hypothetical protein